MATRWGGKEANIIHGNTEFGATNTLNEAVLGKAEDGLRREEMDARSSLDSSILAMFENSSTPAEARSRVEEESESSLLCALTEILDSVGDETLSPFDSLPDSALLSGRRRSDSPPVISEMFRSSAAAAKPTNDYPPPSPQPIESGSQRTEAEQEVFTSASLVNLVRLMHPYCLRVCLEEEGNSWVTASRRKGFPWGKTSSDHMVPLEGEIWKYEKPTDTVDSDEEIDVDVSDDDSPAKRMKREVEEEEDGRIGGKRDGGGLRTLRGVLVKSEEDNVRSQTTKEKKKVRFAPVLVTSYQIPAAEEHDLSEFPDLSELTEGIVTSETLASTKNPSVSESSTKQPSDTGLDEISEVGLLPATARQPGGDPKPKPLSLQQYRQLRLEKRLPLVEKQGNCAPSWPSLLETPKELTPIPCLHGTGLHKPPGLHVAPGSGGIRTHGHERDVCGFGSEVDRMKKTTRPVVLLKAVETASSKDTGVRVPKRVRIGIKTRATLPVTVNLSNPTPVAVTQIKISPEKRSSPDKRLLVSSDPPNPVLVPLPSGRPSVEQSDRPPLSTHPTRAPGPEKIFCNRDPNLKSTSRLLEIQKRLSKGLPPKEPVTTNSPIKSPTVPPTQPTKSKAETCKQSQQQHNTHSKRTELESSPKRSDAPENSQAMIHTSWPSITPPILTQNLSPEEESADGTHLKMIPPGPPSTTSTQGSVVAQAPACDSGIEAADLTSLLEQFEETQAIENHQEEQTPSPLEGSTAARHLSVSELEQTSTPEVIRSPTMENFRTQASGIPESLVIPEQLLGTVDDVTTPEPLSDEIVLGGGEIAPAVPRWKPLASAIPQKKQPVSPKLTHPKAIQIIDPRPLLARKPHGSTPKPTATPTTFQIQIAVSVSSDHDYCACQGQPAANVTQCNKTQAAGYNANANSATRRLSTVLDAIANRTLNNVQLQVRNAALDRRTPEPFFASTCSTTPRSEAGTATEAQEGEGSKPCSPSPSPPRAERGRGETRRYRGRSHHSDSRSPLSSSSSSSSSSSPSSSGSSSSPSRSRSPRRKRFRPRRSESSSCSSSCSGSRSPTRRYRIPYSRTRPSRSRSRSESWSKSRSRSPACHLPRGRRRDIYSPTYHPTSITESRKRKRQQDLKLQKLQAIDERRVVYVGRIRRTMTHEELRERFSLFGEVENCSLHFRDRGDHYGFVTFYNMEDAFAAIENGIKLRRPDELPFDLCFGGRRQFCKSGYADLDSNREVEPPPAPNRLGELDFDSLLKQAQKNLKR